MTHTPSPWSASIDRHGFVTLSAGAAYVKNTTDGFNIAGFLSPADAHLIRAAPDLLHALSDALEIFEMTDACNDPPSDAWAWTYAARAAIAKAKGE
jgi:hypothetical protein